MPGPNRTGRFSRKCPRLIIASTAVLQVFFVGTRPLSPRTSDHSSSWLISAARAPWISSVCAIFTHVGSAGDHSPEAHTGTA